jgi:hypothetical protein
MEKGLKINKKLSSICNNANPKNNSCTQEVLLFIVNLRMEKKGIVIRINNHTCSITKLFLL